MSSEVVHSVQLVVGDCVHRWIFSCLTSCNGKRRRRKIKIIYEKNCLNTMNSCSIEKWRNRSTNDQPTDRSSVPCVHHFTKDTLDRNNRFGLSDSNDSFDINLKCNLFLLFLNDKWLVLDIEAICWVLNTEQMNYIQCHLINWKKLIKSHNESYWLY